MVPVVLTLLTVHYLPILETVMTPHHIMEHLMYPYLLHQLETIKGSLLPDPFRHMSILSYQPHPLQLLRIPRYHLLRLKP